MVSINYINLIIELISPLLPVLFLLIGGQHILNLYALRQKEREASIALVMRIRNEQYKTLEEVYGVFGKFMQLFRILNSPDKEKRNGLFIEITQAEAQIDSLILKIGSEFVNETDNVSEIEIMLGELRQSVHIWRESYVNNTKLPFNISSQEDYMRFKISFARVSSFMSNRIRERIQIDNITLITSEKLLVGSFDRKHENWKQGHFYTGG